MREHVGEMVVDGRRVRVSAELRDGCLYLYREPMEALAGADWPITLVTREGLLRLSQGPYETGYVEDHL